MFKKAKAILMIFVITVVLLVIFPIGWYFWQLNWPPSPRPDDLSNQSVPMLERYYNVKHNYSVKFPEKWFIGYLGDDKKTANVVWFVSNSDDWELADGGVPLGARIEVMVLENYDSLSLADWVKQMLSQGPEQKNLSQENITVAGKSAIRLTTAPLDNDAVQAGAPISIYFSRGQYVFVVNYLGREPDYSNNLDIFNQTINSFIFN